MQVVSKDLLRRVGAGLLIVIALLLSLGVRATHIIGGDMSMQAVGATPGLFKLQLNQYWDETKTNTVNRDLLVKVLIYRKNNPILVERVEIPFQEMLPLTFDNTACATLRQLSFTQARYYITHQFDPQKYTDPGGYYIVWERCCRNDALTNVNTSTTAGAAMVFYLEFPPMQKNGTRFVNSAPDFRLPNGSYICINKPFTFNVDAVDADGDQLRYSLVTPLNGYTTRNDQTSIDDSPRSSYPPIMWAPGYSLTNIIPGNPALSINSSTGQLSVRASQEGLYLFTVQCEEFRNGVRIGVVRRDFQLPVVDCSQNAPPPAVVLVNGKPVVELLWCDNQPVVLSVERDSKWAYQWQKDGANIRGATSDTLTIKASGVYTVVKSLANVCANDTTSQAVKVALGTLTAEIKSSSSTFCADDSVQLSVANPGNGNKYVWEINGTKLSDTSSHIIARQAGTYLVHVTSSSGCKANSNQLTLTQYARPSVSLDSIAPICVTNSTVVTLQGQPSGGTYTGPGVQGSQFNPATAGVGRHKITYTVIGDHGCKATQTRWAVVTAAPTLTGQATYQITVGDSVQLITQTDMPVNTYQWTPPTSLSRADVASPKASPAVTTPYQVTATSAPGCFATLPVLVVVVTPLFIPSAFSPNADGRNDVWIIPNISAFPQCEVSIFSRWGELIFFSQGYAQPWDGTYKKVPVETGIYTYQIRTGTGSLTTTYRGQLAVIH
ncbi:T9SS type B sorting domain-containing protein [Spirosoma jeollabukense]